MITEFSRHIRQLTLHGNILANIFLTCRQRIGCIAQFLFISFNCVAKRTKDCNKAADHKNSGRQRHDDWMFFKHRSQRKRCDKPCIYAMDYNTNCGQCTSDNRKNNCPASKRFRTAGNHADKSGHHIVPALNNICVKQRIESFLGHRQTFLRCSNAVLIHSIFLCRRTSRIHRKTIQFHHPAVVLAGLRHIFHQRQENVLLFDACHGGCDVRFCLAVQLIPVRSDIGEDVFHLSPVAFVIKQCDVDFIQSLRDVIDLGIVIRIKSGTPNTVQTGNQCIERSTDRGSFLPGRFRHRRDRGSKPLEFDAKGTSRRSRFLHGSTDFFTARCRVITNDQEYVRNPLCRVPAILHRLFFHVHRVNNRCNQFSRLFEFNVGRLRIHGCTLQSGFNLIRTKALTSKINRCISHIFRRNTHVRSYLTISVAKLCNLVITFSGNDLDFVHLVIVFRHILDRICNQTIDHSDRGCNTEVSGQHTGQLTFKFC